MTIRRLRTTEARAILAQELAAVGWQAEPTFTFEDDPRHEATSERWWHANTPPNESSETKRNIAYLRAYIRIAVGMPLYATGILLDRKRLWMDRSVISRLTRDGYLRFEHKGKDPVFTLTEAGIALVEHGAPQQPA